MSKSGFFWKDKKSKFSLIVEQRFRNTSSKPIMMEEVSRNWMELLSPNEVRLIMLMQETNNFDEMNNFFMYNYWYKIGIFAKLKSQWDGKIEAISRLYIRWILEKKIDRRSQTLSLNSQPRFRNYKMKSIVWMIREIFKMLNQYAVDNPTLPVNQCFSHLIQILVEC